MIVIPVTRTAFIGIFLLVMFISGAALTYYNTIEAPTPFFGIGITLLVLSGVFGCIWFVIVCYDKISGAIYFKGDE